MHASATSIPDHLRRAVAREGGMAMVRGPDVVAAGGGGFAVAWHEERFPDVKTVVQLVGGAVHAVSTRRVSP